MNNFLKENSLANKTGKNNDCVIHIILNEKFFENKKNKTERHKIEKNISDHDFVTLELE
ncbi:hypothetical protein FACS189445_3530 [Spirochaetia bacterium]|nr:hypothetical protein FACS189445_3530 [Spirochaetia bacterium]